MKKLLSALLGALIFSTGLQAAEPPAAVSATLERLLPGVKPDSIESTPLPNLWEVMVGPQLFYVTADGRHLIQGSLIDAERRVNLTDSRKAVARLRAIEDVGEDNMLVFAPKGRESKYVLNVFSDIDCGYCRKLHSEMEQYNNLGITVRYMFYPRAGKDSESYRKAVSVWCAKDRHQAMTLAKQGQSIEQKTCDNPVDEHMMLGQLMGISGTPALVLENGEMLPGYVPAERLRPLLDKARQGR